MAARKASVNTLIKSLSIADLQAILAKKAEKEKERLPELRARLSELESEISQVGAEIAAIESASGSAPRRGRPAAKKGGRRRGPGRPKAARAGRRGRRPKRDRTLPQAIATVLAQHKGAMSPAQVRDAILEKNLYGQPTKTFYQQIVIRLSKGKQFVSVGRGQYKLKKK